MNLKRFALFGMKNYYPEGGWSDFITSFYNRQQAVDRGEKDCKGKVYEFYQVIDLTDGSDVTNTSKALTLSSQPQKGE